VTVLTHGHSRVVIAVLERAWVTQGKRFSVIVTEARPNQAGYKTADRLKQFNIPVTIVFDSAIGHIMDGVDLILVGAEGIVGNGGIINTVGTYQIAIVAAAFSKPFYVAAESFKFTLFYPLGQGDLALKIRPNADDNSIKSSDTSSPKVEIHSHDYTPPSCLTLLFTELGVLTPSAVSDELIKVYY